MKTHSLAALSAVVVLGLAGCGTSSQDSGTMSASERDKFLKYSTCMEKQGVDVPGPDNSSDKAAAGAGSGKDPKVEVANAICRKYAPNKGEDKASPEEDAAVKTAECLRRQGIVATDPQPGTADIGIDSGPENTNEEIVAAYRKCGAKQVSAKRG
ncbi:hypothetical protein [Streptomyces sp. NPDC057682]|uniref:hypothetical protein n=1 Tax=Streptomyces sp. NPDC057682 TaxID=3346210 RepID=UPI003673D0A8